MKKRCTKMDLAILAAVILLIAGVFVKTWTLRRNAQEPVPCTYSMELIDPTPGIADALTIGDTVYCNEGKASIGTISGIETADSRVVITLTAEGTPIEGGWRVGFYNILPGLNQDFFTKTAYWNGIVTEVQ